MEQIVFFVFLVYNAETQETTIYRLTQCSPLFSLSLLAIHNSINENR